MLFNTVLTSLLLSLPFSSAVSPTASLVVPNQSGKGNGTSAVNSTATITVAQACADLKASLGSDKVQFAYEPTYEYETQHYYNAAQAENRAACIVLPVSNDEVVAAVKAIRASNASYAVKAGGHTTNTGWSSTKGILIDFANAKDKSYDAASNTATIQPGNRWLDTYSYLAQFNVTVVGGRLSDVGSGLMLGGGLSYLSGQYGLACDNFVSLDVVLISGELVTATKDNKYSDLFWALKGGGNQFGIVTSYTLMTYPTGIFTSGDVTYPPSSIPDILRATENFINKNTDPKAAIIISLSEVVGVGELPLVFLIYDGPTVPAGVFDEFLAIPHISSTVQKRTYLSTTTMNDAGAGYGSNQYFRTGSFRIKNGTLFTAYAAFKKFSDEQYGKWTLTSFDIEPVMQSLIEQSRAKGGNAQESPDGPYAWFNVVIQWTGDLLTEDLQKAAKTWIGSIPSDRDLPLFLNDAAADQPVFESYGSYDRLKSVKAKYDPDGYITAHADGPFFDKTS